MSRGYIDSIPPHKRTTIVQETPAPEPSDKHMIDLSVEPSGSETLTLTGADSVDHSYKRHDKYFFKDGNVTFLVRGFQP